MAVTGVKSHGHATAHRRLHEQRTKIQGKIVDGTLVCLVSQGAAQLALHTRRDQPVICVLGSRPHKGRRTAARDQHRAAHAHERLLTVKFDLGLQKALALSAIDSQHLMSL